MNLLYELSSKSINIFHFNFIIYRIYIKYIKMNINIIFNFLTSKILLKRYINIIFRFNNQ